MSSDRTQSKQSQSSRPRVIKSHQAVDLRFTFPSLEQVAAGDLPPSISSGDLAPVPEAGQVHRSMEETREALQLVEQARTVEARAKAMERRAVAVLQEAEETAARRLEDAEQQVHDLLDRAGEAVAALHEEARESGFAAGREEGFAEGVKEGQAEGKAVIDRARAVAEAMLVEARREAEVVQAEAREERQLLLDSSAEQILDLAFALARQVVKAELSLRSEAILPMLEAALAKLRGEVEPQIRVSPEVAALLEQHRARLLAAVPGARRLKVEGDPGLQPGDFVVQGAQGFVDGRLDRQLEVLEEKVRTEEQ